MFIKDKNNALRWVPRTPEQVNKANSTDAKAARLAKATPTSDKQSILQDGINGLKGSTKSGFRAALFNR